MGTMLAIGGVIGLILWLAGGGQPAPEPGKDDKKVPPPTPGTDMCKDCMCPDAGMSLKEAQQILIGLGMLPATTASGKPGADGVCGPLTTSAIRNYQFSRAIKVSGFVDKPTAQALSGESKPASASSATTELEKQAARDYAAGCSAGSKDAAASISAGAVVNYSYKDAQTSAWYQGYRDCLASSLTGSGYTADEDGSLYPNYLETDGTSTWIGDTMGSPSGSGDAVTSGVNTDRRQTRAGTVRARAHIRRQSL